MWASSSERAAIRTIDALFCSLVLIAGPVGCSSPPDGETAPDLGGKETSSPQAIVGFADAGPDLPPAGRALFDFVITHEGDDRRAYDIPFPLERLVERIDNFTGAAARTRGVLIPIGRSLQRNAANPDFFKYPRAVVGVTTDFAAPAATGRDVSRDTPRVLRDRLFLGYQERAAILEVISYNEAAGRFEFQVVNDYREGGSPEVRYARRAECLPCHQNRAPIFSRPLWGETNANRSISSRLAAERSSFYGIPSVQGVDAPDAIDRATDAANLLSAYQVLWMEGCGAASVAAPRCRAALLLEALRYRLAGSRHWRGAGSEGAGTTRSTTAAAWSVLWPAGLVLPDPDIPNRDPDLSPAPAVDSDLLGLPDELLSDQQVSIADLQQAMDLPRHLEPFAPRPPGVVWGDPVFDAADVEMLIAGLGDFLAAGDIARLDEHLRTRTSAPVVRTPYDCSLRPQGAVPGEPDQTSFALDCAVHPETGSRVAGTLRLQRGGLAGGTMSLTLTARNIFSNLPVDDAPATRSDGETTVEIRLRERLTGRLARFPDGRALGPVVLRWRSDAWSISSPFAASLELSRVDDFSPLARAVGRVAERTAADAAGPFANLPFRRVAVMSAVFAELGATPPDWCCLDPHAMPPPQLNDRRAAGGR